MNDKTTLADATRATRAAENPNSTAEVNASDKTSIAHWAAALGTTDEALVNAIRHVGTRIDKIKDYLGAGGMAGDQSGG